MPTLLNDSQNSTLFMFNHINAQFRVPHAIVTDHGTYFRNHMIIVLSAKLGFCHGNSSSYYHKVNGQVEAIIKVLKTMIQRMVQTHKSNWHLNFFSSLWAYQNSTKTATGFTPFQLVYGLEVVLPIECEIPSLQHDIDLFPNTFVESEWFLYLEKLDETCHDATLANEAHKQCINVQYDKSIHPCTFFEGDLVLIYDQANDKLGESKLEPMWHETYVVKHTLQKGAYKLVDYDGIPMKDP